MFRQTLSTSGLFLTFLLLIIPPQGIGADNTVNDSAQTPDGQAHVNVAPTYTKENPAVLVSDDGKYRVSLYASESPIPFQKIHSWSVHVETTDGKPVDEARIYVHGGMPAHRHGFPTKPQVKTYLGNGDYRIDGIKFSMPGRWEIRLNIKEQTRRDRAVFMIDL